MIPVYVGVRKGKGKQRAGNTIRGRSVHPSETRSNKNENREGRESEREKGEREYKKNEKKE